MCHNILYDADNMKENIKHLEAYCNSEVVRFRNFEKCWLRANERRGSAALADYSFRHWRSLLIGLQLPF